MQSRKTICSIVFLLIVRIIFRSFLTSDMLDEAHSSERLLRSERKVPVCVLLSSSEVLVCTRGHNGLWFRSVYYFFTASSVCKQKNQLSKTVTFTQLHLVVSLPFFFEKGKHILFFDMFNFEERRYNKFISYALFVLGFCSSICRSSCQKA